MEEQTPFGIGDDPNGQQSVTPEIRDALEQQIDQHRELQQALTVSGLPRRFQAMVLGLATIKQMRDAPPPLQR